MFKRPKKTLTNRGMELEPANVSVRIKISGLWTAMLFVFAYIDLFSLYRPDFRADIEAGQISGFTINQTFLVATSIYVVIPALMVFATLVLRPGVNRVTNVVLSIVYALSIVAGVFGEWTYYIFGSAIEVGLLLSIAYYASTWPRTAQPTAFGERGTSPQDIQPALQ